MSHLGGKWFEEGGLGFEKKSEERRGKRSADMAGMQSKAQCVVTWLTSGWSGSVTRVSGSICAVEMRGAERWVLYLCLLALSTSIKCECIAHLK